MTDSTFCVLAVDDEPNNLRALKLDLGDAGYTVLTASDGVEAWDVLQKHGNTIKVILLDRMMPNMNGMELIAKARQDPSVANIPIIMQTAAAERSQVVEGIQAGVYYYLIKPYDRDIMLSVVKAAINEYGNYRLLRDELKQFKSTLHLIRDSRFELQTMEDAHYLSAFLSQFFPDPERVVFGIHELLVNAVEHGNLGITYEEKTGFSMMDMHREEIARRMKLPENAHKRVHISYTRDDHEITLRIRDEGKGFNWQDFLDLSPERATHNHGRGIALSRMISFDSLEYIGKGNEVVCKIRLQAEEQSLPGAA